MFYKFNGSTGRLESSAREVAYNPQGFSKPLVVSAEQRAYATASSHGASFSSSMFFKHNDVRTKQHSPLSDPHIPTYLRGGARDRALFRGLMGVVVVLYGVAIFGVCQMGLGKGKKQH